MGALDEILDLTPIQLDLVQLVQSSLIRIELVWPSVLDEVLPDMSARFNAEVRVWQEEVDTRLESVVKAVDAVGGEEEDALVVLEEAEEGRDERVAVDVVQGALLEEDVGFVEEEDGLPDGRDVEDARELLLEVARVRAELAGRDGVKRALRELSDGLGTAKASVSGVQTRLGRSTHVKVFPTPGGP